jgi:8-oxo-dGTP diphosphatase
VNEQRLPLNQSTKLVYSLVSQILPYDDIEQKHIEDTLHWIESGINIYRIKSPDKPPKHLVSYFVLIDPDHDKLLLVDHIKAQLWLPSGGHVELNEDPKDTVIREMKEELNLETTFLRNSDRPFFVTVTETVGLTTGHTDISLWYLVQGNIADRIIFSRDEFRDVQWFTFKQVLDTDPATLDPNMPRFTNKLISFLGE